MNCPKCGYPVPDGSEFCQYCGERVSTGNPAGDSAAAYAPFPPAAPPAPVMPPIPQPASYMETAPPPAFQQPPYPVYASSTPYYTAEPTPAVKQQFCKCCGSPVDPASHKCVNCGKQYFHLEITLPLLILFIVAVISLGLNLIQLINSQQAAQRIQELESQVSSSATGWRPY